MFGLIKSLTSLASDVVEIAVTPLEVSADIAEAVISPIADVAKETKETIKEITKG